MASNKKIAQLFAGSALIAAFLLAWTSPARCTNCTSSISVSCTIASPGSYTLTANITGGTGADALPVTTAGDVTIDLGGFSIQGGTTSGQAIDGCAGSACTTNVTVKNGHVKSSGTYGIDTDTITDVETTQLTGNTSYAIWPGVVATFSQSAIVNNSNIGINGSSENVTLDAVVTGNSGSGIVTGTGGLVAEVVSASNTGTGISAGTDTGYTRDVTGGNTTGCSGGVSLGQNLCN